MINPYFVWFSFWTVSTTFKFIFNSNYFFSFKGTTHAYLLKRSITQNKYLIPFLHLLSNCISATSTPQILFLNEEWTLLLFNFLIIDLWNSSAICNWFEKDLIPLPGDFISINLKPSKLILFDIHQILGCLQFKSFISENFIWFCSFFQIFIFVISNITLELTFIKIILVNIICICCMHKFLNSFFVFSKRNTSTISKSELF